MDVLKLATIVHLVIYKALRVLAMWACSSLFIGQMLFPLLFVSSAFGPHAKPPNNDNGQDGYSFLCIANL